ncbi:MAG TPA: MXAN_5187 C-terminal domain-containing protein [Myxococcota bacterium]|nr:MXAN_5187 C-terminal domain-containing protein [Myxococcota bacterium]
MGVRHQQDEIDEELDDLDHSLKRLRVEYDQYFLGILKRPPEVLQGRVQKVIVKYANQTLRKTHHKFRFNQLNSKFQIYRQQWGRTMRQIEQGTYKGHVFRARLHERERGISDATPSPLKAPPPQERPGAIDKLFEAFSAARQRVGDKSAAPDRAKLAEIVKKQTAALKQKHPGAKVKFRVSIEGNKAKLVASVVKS